MATRRFNLLDRATFTASIGDTPIAIAGGRYIDHFTLGFRGTIAVATVALTSFLALVNPIQIKVNGNPIVSMRGLDMLALNLLWNYPGAEIFLGAVAAADAVDGIRLPVWYSVGATDSISYLITRVAVTNISAEIISLSYVTKEGIQRPGRYDLVELSGTTPAATGVFTAIPNLPNKGLLRGLLLFSNTPNSTTVDAPTIRRINLYRNDSLDYRAMWQDLQGEAVTTAAYADVVEATRFLVNYRWIDLQDDPWDLTTARVRVDIDSGVASDPFRIIPVYTVAGAGAPGAPAPAR